MSITLSHTDAEVLLAEFDVFSFGRIRHDKELFAAILKLAGVTHQEGDVVWVLRADNNYINMIQSVRSILGLGLKEAKDYVDGHTGMRRANGDVVIDPQYSMIGTSIGVVRESIPCRIGYELG